MNQVNICGKIIRMKHCQKVSYITVAVVSGKQAAEFIQITVFQTDFLKKYFHEKKWIGISGHIHVNNESHGYSTEIIADNIFFVGDKEKAVSWDELTSENSISQYEL